MVDGSHLDSVVIVLSNTRQMLSFLRSRSGQEIRDWVSAEVLALQHHSSELHVLHNSTLPVHSLPREILVDILHRASVRATGKAWLDQAASICRIWREVIMNTPTLWSEIDLPMDPPLVKLCLTRSLNAGLSLRLEPVSHWFHVSAVLSLLAPHHARISRLTLDSEKFDPNHWNYLDSVFIPFLRIAGTVLPKLSSLTILVSFQQSYRNDALGLQLKEEHLPSIRRLTISGIRLRWEGQWPLQHLIHLYLDNAKYQREDGRKRDRMTSTLQILEVCSALETFMFAYDGGYDGDPPSAQSESQTTELLDRSVVHLRKMRGFRFGTVQTEDIVALLERVSFPRDASVDIQAFDYQVQLDPDSDCSPLIGGILPATGAESSIPALAHIRHVSIWQQDNQLYVWADEHRRYGVSTTAITWNTELTRLDPQLNIGCTLPENAPLDNVLGIAMRELDTFFPSFLESLLLHGAMHTIDRGTWDRTFAVFPHIQTVSIVAPRLVGLENCLEALRPMGPLIPCTNLCTLLFQYCPTDDEGDRAVLDTLRDVLSVRCEAGLRLRTLDIKVSSNTPVEQLSTGQTEALLTVVNEARPGLELVVEKLSVSIARGK